MNTSPQAWSRAVLRHRSMLACSLAVCAVASPLSSRALGTSYEWDIELTSMDLNANGVLLPLGPGWTPILTDLHIGESVALASTGKAFASTGDVGQVSGGPGDLYRVNSFFDVFFDISLSDVDPDVNFGGVPTHGLTMMYPNIGPAHMQNSYVLPADENLPNLGLIPPPENFPYIGHFLIEIPLGADLNGNGVNDKIKFTLAAHQVNGENRTFIQLPDGTVVDNFDSVLDLSGSVVDELDDPPFGPISLNGPTTATSILVGGDVPEPSTYAAALAVFGLVGWTLGMRRHQQRQA